jgi:HK97 family phage portal protein
VGVIGAFFSGVSGIRAAAGGSSAAFDVSNDRFWSGGAFWGKSAAGMRVTPETAKRLAVVLACVSKRATAKAMLPCRIYAEDGVGGKTVAPNHPLYDVLYRQPNHLQTAFEFYQMMQAHVDLRGNAFAEKIEGPRGPVDELMPMHPDRVQVEQLLGSGKMRYRYNDPLTNTTRVLMQEEVFHLRWMPDVTGLGQSRIYLGADVLGVALAQQEYVARFMDNDATPGALITGAVFKEEADEDQFVESLKKSRTRENRGRPFLLPPGVDMKTLSVTPVQQQLLEAMRASDSRICTMFDVLPHVVGVDAGKAATFASTEQFNLMHVQQCVLPMTIMWEEAIQRDLITNDRYFAKHDLSALLAGDRETQGDYLTQGQQKGRLNVDEARELEGRNPLPNGLGKKYFRSVQVVPLDQVDPPQRALPMPAGTDDDDDDEDDVDTGTGGGDETDNGEQARHDASRKTMALAEAHGRWRAGRAA